MSENGWLKPCKAEDANKGGQQQHSILRGLANPRVLALALIYFGTSAGCMPLAFGHLKSLRNWVSAQ